MYTGSLRHRARCVVEHAVSSLVLGVPSASTHYAYPLRVGQAELACMGS